MYRIRSARVAKTALTFATLAAAFYAVAFLIFAILMFSWTVIGPMFHQPIHSLAAKEAAMLPLVSPIIFVIMWLFFYPFAALFCYLYNQVAKITGGIEFTTF